MAREGNIGVVINNNPPPSTNITDLDASTLALIGTAPGRDPSVPLNEPFLIQPTTQALLGATGSLPDAVADVYTQRGDSGKQGALMVVVVEEGVDEAGHIANVAGAEATLTGAWALLNALTTTGLRPGIIAAPGWTHQRDGGKNAAAAALEQVGALLEAHGVIDLPDTPVVADLNTYIGEFDTRWLTAWYPFLKVTRGAAEVIRPPSGFIAGLMSTLEVEKGIQFSTLNAPLRVVHGLTQPMTYGSTNSIATIFGNNAINCLVRGKSGVKGYGDETTATSDEQFLSLAGSRTVADMTLEIKTFLEANYLGRPMNAGFFAGAEQAVTKLVDARIAAGSINDGLFRVDEIRQTPEESQNRNAHFKLVLVLALPARKISVQRTVAAEITVPVAVAV